MGSSGKRLASALDEEDFSFVDDADDTSTDEDLCGTCGCPRKKHEDFEGRCVAHVTCKRFKESK